MTEELKTLTRTEKGEEGVKYHKKGQGGQSTTGLNKLNRTEKGVEDDFSREREREGRVTAEMKTYMKCIEKEEEDDVPEADYRVEDTAQRRERMVKCYEKGNKN